MLDSESTADGSSAKSTAFPDTPLGALLVLSEALDKSDDSDG